MMYLLYALMALFSLPLTLACLLLSPVLPLFASQVDGLINNGSRMGVGYRLPTWLSWFQTPDNDLNGDDTFILANGAGYLARVKWICRNPAYGFGLRYIKGDRILASCSGDPTIKDNDNAKEGTLFVQSQGLFQWVYVKRISNTSRCIYINLGWNIRALVDPNATIGDDYQATFVFSPRISGFR